MIRNTMLILKVIYLNIGYEAHCFICLCVCGRAYVCVRIYVYMHIYVCACVRAFDPKPNGYTERNLFPDFFTILYYSCSDRDMVTAMRRNPPGCGFESGL